MNMSESPSPRDLVLHDRVHRAAFTDPGIFQLELQRIFYKLWVYVGHESEIAEPGSYKTTRIGTQPVILTRTNKGELCVMLNACRHRATTVCQAERGKARHFVCAYHGWTYDLEGKLISVPWRQNQSCNFNESELGLVRLPRVESYRGFVFASFDAQVEPLTDYLGGVRPFLDYFVDLAPEGEIQLAPAPNKYEYSGNWKQQIENAMDGYHPAITHASFFKLVQERLGDQGSGAMKRFGYDASSPTECRYLGKGHALLDMRKVDRSQMLGAGVSQEAENEFRARLRARLGEERARELLGFRGGDGFNLLVYPNLVLINVQVRVVFPVAPGRTEVHAYPALLKGAPDAINAARIRAHEDFYGPASMGAPDDIEMFARQWDGLQASSLEWLLYERGLDNERAEGEQRVGQFTDEVAQRGMWAHWKQLMQEGGR
jgi:phenylpropionate dioxygenase-like ring-hydroxylating dioxygenase large terminal subunit